MPRWPTCIHQWLSNVQCPKPWYDARPHSTPFTSHCHVTGCNCIAIAIHITWLLLPPDSSVACHYIFAVTATLMRRQGMIVVVIMASLLSSSSWWDCCPRVIVITTRLLSAQWLGLSHYLFFICHLAFLQICGLNNKIKVILDEVRQQEKVQDKQEITAHNIETYHSTGFCHPLLIKRSQQQND
jgi:hypothetical protein